MLHQQLIHALQIELVCASAELIERLVQRVVSFLRRHVLDREVGDLERGEDAGEDHVGTHLQRRPSRDPEKLPQPGLHATETVSVEADRIEVGLEVEQRELVGDARVVDPSEDLGGHRRRLPVVIDQEHLLFGPDAAHVGLDGAGVQHLFQSLYVAQQVAREAAETFRVSRSHLLIPHAAKLTAR